MFPEDVASQAREVRMLVLDVDGVLTDGGLHYGPDGEVMKRFHAHDGLGLKLLRRAGVELAVISAKRSAPLARRLADLGIERAYLGREDKARAMASLLAETGLALLDLAYVGDDLSDLPLLRRVGLPLSVAGAHPRAQAAARWVSERRGGDGAVREICDAILAARGTLDDAIEAYLAEQGDPARLLEEGGA